MLILIKCPCGDLQEREVEKTKKLVQIEFCEHCTELILMEHYTTDTKHWIGSQGAKRLIQKLDANSPVNYKSRIHA